MTRVSLTSEAYARLKAVKQQGESFSDVVMQHVPQKIDLKDFLGSCKGMDADKLNVRIKSERRRRW
jgi:predicted CopG family antitoxin